MERERGKESGGGDARAGAASGSDPRPKRAPDEHFAPTGLHCLFDLDSLDLLAQDDVRLGRWL